MSNMQIYGVNLFNTITMFYTSSLTATSSITETSIYLFDRNDTTIFSGNFGASWTICGFHTYITPSSSVDVIAISGMSTTNMVGLYIYIDTTTSLVNISNCDTSIAYWSTYCPSGDIFLKFISTTVVSTKIGFQFIVSVGVAGVINIGDLFIGEHKFTWPHNPSAKNYKQKFDRTEYKHKMSDGGSATYIISDNFVADIKDEFLSTTSMNELLDIYKEHSPITFIPFPTGTGWNGQIYECNWVDDFEFDYSDNYTGNGHDIRIKLEETAK
jgi:hypothetical protein